MHSLCWEKVKTSFEWDGSLRDIYLFSTTIEDWRKLLIRLKDSYPLIFSINDGEKCGSLPSVEDIHAMRNHVSPLLNVDICGITANCHFFCVEIIEFDIDPREVSCQEKFDTLLDFMRSIGNSTGKDVVLTPENLAENPFIKYAHSTDEFCFIESDLSY